MYKICIRWLFLLHLDLNIDDKSNIKTKGLWEDWHMRQAVDQATRVNHRSGNTYKHKYVLLACSRQTLIIFFVFIYRSYFVIPHREPQHLRGHNAHHPDIQQSEPLGRSTFPEHHLRPGQPSWDGTRQKRNPGGDVGTAA